jgi:hypothetical protein
MKLAKINKYLRMVGLVLVIEWDRMIDGGRVHSLWFERSAKYDVRSKP